MGSVESNLRLLDPSQSYDKVGSDEAEKKCLKIKPLCTYGAEWFNLIYKGQACGKIDFTHIIKEIRAGNGAIDFIL